MNRSILAIYISTVGVYRQYVYISLYRTIIYTNIYNYIGIYSLIYVVPSDIFVSYKLVPEVRMSYKIICYFSSLPLAGLRDKLGT